MKNKGTLLLLTLAGLLMSGCYITKRGPEFDARAYRNATVVTNLASVESTNTIRREWLQPSTNFFTLGPGDRL